MDTNVDNTLLAKTFFRMFLGLAGTAIAAWYTYASGLFANIILSGGFELLLLLELVVVLLFSFLFKKLPATFVTILFFLYAFLNGITMSVIFVVFEMSSIVYVFLGTAGLFACLAYLGYKTETDLSNWRNILYPALFIGIILSIINLFLGNSMLEVMIDWFVLAIFVGLTIYDMNKIKQMQEIDTLDPEKIHIYAAMQLYLDFINLFLRILRLFGKRRN